MRVLPGRTSRALVLAVCAAPIVAQAVLVPRFGVNVLISDEWALVQFVRLVVEGGDWPARLFDFFNENRFAVARALLALSVPYTRWDAMPMMYLTVVVSAATILGLWRLYRGATDLPAAYFIPVAWLAVGLAQYQNLFWALQITFPLTACGAVWGLVAAARPGAWWLAGAMLSALFATFCSAGGTLIWPVILVVLVGRRAGVVAASVWLVAMAATGWAYTRGLESSVAPAGLGLTQAWSWVQFSVAMLGAVLMPTRVEDAVAAGTVYTLALAGVAGLLVGRRRSITPGQWAVVGLVLFAATYAGVTTLGRARFGLDWALTSRYVTITVLAWIGLYVLALEVARGLPSPRWAVRAVAAAVMTAAVAADVQSWQGARQWARHYGRINKFVLQTHPVIGDVALRAMTIHPDHVRDVQREREFLARHRLSYFHDPVEWWLLVDDSRPGGMYLAENAPVVQRFRCPVNVLHDVALQLGPGRDAPQARLRLQVVDPSSGAVLASRRIERAEVAGDGRFAVALNRPLTSCRGVLLEFIATAEPGSGSDAFATYHYNGFLHGVLRAGEPIPGRSLGLEINTRRFDIRDVR